MKKEMYGEELIEAILATYKRGGKVLICGNGGLASASEHFAAELVGKFAYDFYIPCIALTTNTSLLTALANDLGFEEVFAHQAKVLGNSGDILIAMTTSASPNILKALTAGKVKELVTFFICGPSSPNPESHYTYRMKCEDHVARIQDDIMSFLHYIAYNVKRRLTTC